MSLAMNRRAFVKGAALCGAAIASVPAALALADDAAETEETEEGAETSGDGVVLQIFAANSLEKAMPEVQALYTEQHPEVTFADTQFKASGDLVEQMTAGAVVDILITASKGTMDDAEEGGLIDPETRMTMFNNDLVVVAAEDSDVVIEDIADVAGDDIASIAIGDAATVPAGKYANQALYSVGLYTGENGDDGDYAPEIADKVNLGDKVGTCASWVSTGDCTVGFVYSSDVYRYDGIKAIYTTPEDSHGAIVYPGAVGTDAPNPAEAADFLDFCMNDPDALRVWSEYGFEVAEEEEPAADAEAGDEGDAAAAGAYADGTYEGTGKGIGGDVPVTVTVEGGVITAVEVGDNSETQGIGSNAIEQLPALIVEANGTEGVDGVSGATVTSNAIFDAVEEALEQAQA